MSGLKLKLINLTKILLCSPLPWFELPPKCSDASVVLVSNAFPINYASVLILIILMRTIFAATVAGLFYVVWGGWRFCLPHLTGKQLRYCKRSLFVFADNEVVYALSVSSLMDLASTLARLKLGSVGIIWANWKIPFRNGDQKTIL